MGSYHPSGLNEWTRNFLYGPKKILYTEKITRVYPDGTEEKAEDRPVHSPLVEVMPIQKIYTDSVGTTHVLYEYYFPDGRRYSEEVQKECFLMKTILFRALKDEQGDWVKGSLWSEEAIWSIGELQEGL